MYSLVKSYLYPSKDMKFCPCCKLMSAEKLVPCFICQRSVCHTPCRTRCKECWKLVCTDEMTECSNCDKSICLTCQESKTDMWRIRPECCMDKLPPLCSDCPESHQLYQCNSCGMENSCEDTTYVCFCEHKFCHDCTDLYTTGHGCVLCLSDPRKNK